jgi:hypothetical protein
MAERLARVQRLIEAARTLPSDAALRRRLQDTTGLSAENIALGLERCLELQPLPEHLDDLLASTPEAPTAHVLLSGNVFVAALRAIAIGVASSTQVRVRASRRDPVLAEALHAAAPDLFELVPKLEPSSGDHLWSYGSDETLADVRASLPRGVWFHAHGSGFGAVVVNARSFTESAARAIALDTSLFDQRGCLSPRVVCVLGERAQTRDVAAALAGALAGLQTELPPGPRDAIQLAELRRHRDAAAYAFELWDAGSGWVSLSEAVVVPPADRNLHVVACADPIAALSPFASHLTNVAYDDQNLFAPLRLAFEGARLVAPGDMQRPALDGPVDRRHGARGEHL